MVSRVLIACALALSLSGCIGEPEVVLMGTEAEAHRVCAPNGGVSQIEIATWRQEEWVSYVTVYCKNDRIEAKIVGRAGDDQIAKFDKS